MSDNSDETTPDRASFDGAALPPPLPRAQPGPVDWLGEDVSWPPPRDARPSPDDGCRTHADTPEPVTAVDYENRAIAPVQAAWNAAHRVEAVPKPPPRRRPERRPDPYSTSRLARTCVAVIVLGLMSAFVAWVSAEPLWLSLGHRTEGTVVVGECDDDVFAPRCEGAFVPDGEHSLSATVRIAGDSDAERAGAELDALAVGDDPRTVYIGSTEGLVLRWSVGLLALALCGFGLAWAVGAWRMPAGVRRWAVTATLGAPFALFVGALAFTW